MIETDGVPHRAADGVIRGVHDGDTAAAVAEGVAAWVGADEVPLDDDLIRRDMDPVARVARDHVARAGVGAADRVRRAGIVDIHAIAAVAQDIGTGGVGPDEVARDDGPRRRRRAVKGDKTYAVGLVAGD